MTRMQRQDLVEGFDRMWDARRRRPLLVLFDYDGTLVPIARRPGLARLSPARRRALAALAATPGVTVAVITGRSLSDISRLVSIPYAILSANHGFEIAAGRRVFLPRGRRFRHPLVRLAQELAKDLRDIPGLLVEPKGFSVAIHFRLTPRRLWKGVERRVRLISRPWRRRHGLRVTGGKCIWEIRPALHWNKGDAALWIWRRFAADAVTWYIGDDATDEDAFRALRKKGITAVVGRAKASRAAFSIRNVEGVWRLIRRLKQATAPSRPSTSRSP